MIRNPNPNSLECESETPAPLQGGRSALSPLNFNVNDTANVLQPLTSRADSSQLNNDYNPCPSKRRALLPVSDTPIIPAQFAQHGAAFSNSYEPETLRSYVGKFAHVIGPNKFYITTNRDAHRLKAMQDKITSFYDELVKSGKFCSPVPELLKSGLLVVCFSWWHDGDWHWNWMRARIIRTSSHIVDEDKPDAYEVFFVDYGRFATVELDSIHYLSKKHLQSPCALQCRLGFKTDAYSKRRFECKIMVLPSGLKYDRWGIKTSTRFHELTMSKFKIISVKFYGKIADPDKPVWAVQIKTLVKGKLRYDTRRVSMVEEIQSSEQIPIKDFFIPAPAYEGFDEGANEEVDGESDEETVNSERDVHSATTQTELIEFDDECEVPILEPSFNSGDTSDSEYETASSSSQTS